MSDSLLSCSPPGFSVHGISQEGRLKWIAISFSRGSSQPRDQTCVSCISCIGRQVLTTEQPRRLNSKGTSPHFAGWEMWPREVRDLPCITSLLRVEADSVHFCLHQSLFTGSSLRGAEVPSLRGMGTPMRDSWAGSLCMSQQGAHTCASCPTLVGARKTALFPTNSTSVQSGLFSIFLGLTGSSNAECDPVATQDVE